MSSVNQELIQDVMQVCRNGHVISDRLRTSPEAGRNHCERCGATTIDRCPTCGQELSGALLVPGLLPIGGKQPPPYCSNCGVAFPWAPRRRPPAVDPRSTVEHLLRRLPRVIRQLRLRHGDRPPFRVEDGKDLEDLLRALLPLHFDDVRPQSRTPRYADQTCTDYLLEPEKIIVVAKYAGPAINEKRLVEQIREDTLYWSQQPNCSTFIGFVYDPDGLLRDARCLEATWSAQETSIQVCCVIGAT
jgi:hypothetical protein